jgi:hypothetical protein
MTHGTKFTLGIALILGLLAWGLYALSVHTTPTPSTEQQNATSTQSTPNPAGTVESGQTAGEQCQSMGGTWSEQYKECTGIGANSCQEIGGTFNECASACRHDPNAQACIMMCVQVCTIN